MHGINGKLLYLYGSLHNVILCYNAKIGSFPETVAHVPIHQDSSKHLNIVLSIVPKYI